MATDWLNVPLDEDFDTAVHTHITASVPFLCSLSVSRGHNLNELVRSVQVPIHCRSGLALCRGHLDPPNVNTGELDKLFPHCLELGTVLARVCVSWAKYKWWLRKLEETPLRDLTFV